MMVWTFTFLFHDESLGLDGFGLVLIGLDWILTDYWCRCCFGHSLASKWVSIGDVFWTTPLSSGL